MVKVTLTQCDRPTVDDLLAMAHGRWHEILTDAGVPSDAITDDRRGRPCPRCGGRDRFALLPDFAARGAVMCRHCFHAGTDPRPGDGLATLRWWLGLSAAEAVRWLSAWLGVGGGNAPAVRRPIERRLSIPADAAADDRFAEMSDRWFCAMREAWRARCAELLGLRDVDPLMRLQTGWADEHKATSWPMCDASGRVIGIRLRCPKTARKWAVTGSRAGLFMPKGLTPCGRCLFVCEGPTDTAALLSVSLDAIGVPSAGGAVDLVADVARKLRPAEAVIVADGDGPGRAGAERLADAMMMVRPVRVITPPAGVKDARAWVASGVGRDVIEAVADAAPARRLQIGRASS
jgi:phage/plasmid primase-like uncharacterized protein